MKTGSNTSPRPVTTYCVQFNVALVQHLYRKSKIRPILKFFPYTEIPLTQWKFHIEAVYFKKQHFYQRILHVGWNYSQFIFLIFHIHLLGYPLLQHTEFQKLPVSFVR